MRSLRPFRVVCAALPALLLSNPAVRAQTAPDLELARRLPQDSVLYLSTAPLAELAKAREQGGLSQALARFQPLLDQLQDPNQAAALEQSLGFKLEDWPKLFAGPLSIGIGPLHVARFGTASPVSVVVRVGIGDVRLFESARARADEAAGKQGEPVQVEDWQGTRVAIYGKPGKFRVWSAYAGGHAYLATDPELLRRVLGEPAESSLASAGRFRQVVGELGSGAEGFAYVDVRALLTAAKQASAGTSQGRQKEWAMSGLDSVSHLTFRSNWRGKAALSRLDLAFEGAPQGALGLASRLLASPLESLSRIPADATLASAIRFEPFPRLLERYLAFLREFGPPGAAQRTEQALAEAGRSLGVELRSRLLDRLAGELAFYLWLPEVSPGVLDNPILLAGLLPQLRLGVLAKLENAQGVDETLRDALQRAGVRVDAAEHRGTPVRLLTVPGSPAPPAYALSGDWLILGSNEASVAAILDAGAAGGSSLQQAPIWSQLEGSSQASALGYLDAVRLGRVVGPVMLAALRKQRPDVDLSGAPSVEEAAALLEPEVSSLHLAPQRWTMQSYSTTGATMPAAVTGVVAAIAIPSLLRARMSANEASASGALKTLAAAQMDYNNNSSPHTFAASLEALRTGEGGGNVRYIADELASGLRNGYAITMQAGRVACKKGELFDTPDMEPGESDFSGAGQRAAECTASGGTPVYTRWRAEAHPVVYKRTGIRSFYIDETGILLGDDVQGGSGTDAMPEI